MIYYTKLFQVSNISNILFYNIHYKNKIKYSILLKYKMNHNYVDKLQDLVNKRYGKDAYVPVLEATEAETIFKILNDRTGLNKFINKPINENASALFCYYIGLYHNYKSLSLDAERWLLTAHKKGCTKGLWVLIYINESNLMKMARYCLIGYETAREEVSEYIKKNLTKILIGMQILIEEGNSRYLVDYIKICFDYRNFEKLMMLMDLETVPKLSNDEKNEINITLEKFKAEMAAGNCETDTQINMKVLSRVLNGEQELSSESSDGEFNSDFSSNEEELSSEGSEEFNSDCSSPEKSSKDSKSGSDNSEKKSSLKESSESVSVETNQITNETVNEIKTCESKQTEVSDEESSSECSDEEPNSDELEYYDEDIQSLRRKLGL